MNDAPIEPGLTKLVEEIRARSCMECGQDCIAMCQCGARVHQDFGLNGAGCSLKHEQRCEIARESRRPA